MNPGPKRKLKNVYKLNKFCLNPWLHKFINCAMMSIGEGITPLLIFQKIEILERAF